VEPLSLDEAYLDVTENALGLTLGGDVALALKRRIRNELSLTASAGVAPNKFLAKIASGFRKPDGLTIIAPERVEQFLQQLPVEALWGVGPVTARKLHGLGVRRLVELRTVDPLALAGAVGSLAEWLLRLAHGDDPRPVNPVRERKSVSAESTYATDLSGLAAMDAELLRLADRVAETLRRSNLVGRTVGIKVRYADFTTVTRNQSAEPGTADRDAIARRAAVLLRRTAAGTRAVRLLGVGMHGLARAGDRFAESRSLLPDDPVAEP
jgi:DNA polymerase IV